MATALLEPPTSVEELQEQAQQLKQDVDEALDEGVNTNAAIDAAADETAHADRISDRDAWFAEINRLIRSVTKSPVWHAHDLARELLVTRDDLAEAIVADPDATDPAWAQRAALKRMQVVIEAMIRQLVHHAIDRPDIAAQFVARQLSDVGDADVARLLGTTPRMVSKYRSEGVKEIRKDPDRVSLVGQLVYELQSARTPRGVVLWFDAPRQALAERTPLQLIEENVASARESLIPLARGGRGQLDTAGRGAVE